MAEQSRIIRGSEIREFNFFWHGSIYRGGSMHNRLYKLVAEYQADSRLKAFQFAAELEHNGITPLVSVEWNGARRVWVDVAAPLAPLAVDQLQSRPQQTQPPSKASTPWFQPSMPAFA